MRKNKKVLIGAVIVILLVILLAVFKGGFFVIGSGFTPIFCNDYEFTCCNDVVDYQQPFTLSLKDALICPTTATKCIINPTNWNNPNMVKSLSYGTTNCQYSCTLWVFCGWGCNNQVKANSFPITLNPGQYIWYGESSIGDVAINNEVHKNNLAFCGRAGCTTGVPVSGADGCKFNPPGGKVYSSSSLTNPTTTSSFTVPAGSCVLAWQGSDRHICGYKEESCSADTDCTGHQFGNQDCNARTLQTYGCTSFGTVIQTTTENGVLIKGDTVADNNGGGDTPDASQIDSNTFGKRCSITSAITVPCCGDTDCGSTYFCDRTKGFTCQPKVQCTQNVDCGVSTQCDYVTKKLKTPKCSSGTCGWDEVSVGCCNDGNCAVGDYCTADKKCEPRIADCLTCPYECCDKECKANGGFLDRPCPTDKPFCNNHACSTTPPDKTKCVDCDAFVMNTLFGSFWESKACTPTLLALPPQTNTTCFMSWIKFALMFIVFLFGILFGKDIFANIKSIRKYKWLHWVLSLIVALVLSYLVYVMFWVGVIIFVVYIIIRMIMAQVNPLSILR